MFGRELRRQVAGRPVAARTINGAVDAEARTMRIRAGFGLALQLVAGIPTIRLRYRPSRTLHALLPSGGVAAASASQMTKVTVEVQRTDPRTGLYADAGYSLDAWHKATSGGISGPKRILITLDDDGCWVITWWEC